MSTYPKRCVQVLVSYLSYIVDSHTLIQLYYALIQPFLVHGLILSGETLIIYCTQQHFIHLFILQKKATH